MTTKDELLGYINNESSKAEQEESNAKSRNGVKYWQKQLIILGEIYLILNLHFSISEEEREEAREWIWAWLRVVEKSEDAKLLKIYKTILKTLK